MHDTKVSPDHERLFQVASQQSGYFTTAQAEDCGISHSLLAYHAGDGGRFLRIRRGLYRLRHYPASPREDLLAAWLAAGARSAVISHESALELFDLSDVVPTAVHVTVPRSQRYRPTLPGVQVHTTTRELRPTDVVVRDGMRVTSPVRSILDAAEAGLSPEHVIAAVTQALDRGLTTRSRLENAAGERGSRVERPIAHAIARSPTP